MQELYELHDNILSRGIEVDLEDRIGFSSDEIWDDDAVLPDDIREEIEALQKRIAAEIPDDFDFYAEVGGEKPPIFTLDTGIADAMMAVTTVVSVDESLFPQLRKQNWESLRAEAHELRRAANQMVTLVDFLAGNTRPTKQVQRELREETKEFIKEKRADAAHIFALFWASDDDLKQGTFDDGEELRQTLPSILSGGSEIVTIVAFGKPLPVERIDALIAQARQDIRDRVAARARKYQEEAAAGRAEDIPALDDQQTTQS